MQRKRVQFDDPLYNKLLEKQNELKQLIPSISFSKTVNYCLNLYWRQSELQDAITSAKTK